MTSLGHDRALPCDNASPRLAIGGMQESRPKPAKGFVSGSPNSYPGKLQWAVIIKRRRRF